MKTLDDDATALAPADAAGGPEPEGYCDVCGCAPCRTSGFCAACRGADRDPLVVAERERASARLPADWDGMDFGTLYRALT